MPYAWTDIDSWITQWRALSLPLGFLVACLLNAALYVGAAAEISIVYGVLRRFFRVGALIDARPLPHRQLRNEIRRSLLVCPIFAVPTLLYLHYSNDVWPASWQQALWQVGGFLLLNDFCAYWTHRLLHTPGFSTYHSAHHRSKRVTPWSALSMHPVEALLTQIPSFIFFIVLSIFDLPLGIGTLLGLQLILMIGQANSHSNYDPLAGMNTWPMLQRQTQFHQRHHRFGRDNYGYMGPHWDWVFHTDQRP